HIVNSGITVGISGNIAHVAHMTNRIGLGGMIITGRVIMSAGGRAVIGPAIAVLVDVKTVLTLFKAGNISLYSDAVALFSKGYRAHDIAILCGVNDSYCGRNIHRIGCIGLHRITSHLSRLISLLVSLIILHILLCTTGCQDYHT